MPNLPDQEISDKLMPSQAAKLFGVTTKTLTKMSNLHPIILPSGHRRYLKSEIDAILNSPATPMVPPVDASPASAGGTSFAA